MSFINLYFVTIIGKRIIMTLPEDFQLIDMIEEIRKKINDTAVEDCIFLCKGRRLSMNDPVSFQAQKKKFINNGDVIFVGNKIANWNWNQNEHKIEPSFKVYFITSSGRQIISKIPENFKFADFLKIIEKNFGENAVKNSRFICMGEQLILNDRISFELKKQSIRNGSIILETVQIKENVFTDRNPLVIEEVNVFTNFYILLPILFFLICCIQSLNRISIL